MLRAVLLFGFALGVAQAEPGAGPAPAEGTDPPTASESATPGTGAREATDAEGPRQPQDGRLLPGLLLGLLLGIGAYHIGRQVYDSAPGSRGASALLVSGFLYEYAAFGLHEPLLGTGRPALILSALTVLGVAIAGLGFLSDFLMLKRKDGRARAITRALIVAAIGLAALVPLKPQLARDVADALLALALLWSLGVTTSHARQGDLRAAYLLPGLCVLAAALFGAGALLIAPQLNEGVFVPLLHGLFVIGLLVVAFAVTTAWSETVKPTLALPAPVAPHSGGVQVEQGKAAATPARGAITKDKQLSKALAVAGCGLWEWDIQAGRIAVTPETESLLGLEKGFFDGSEESFLATIAEADREPFRQALGERVRLGGGAFSLSFAVAGKGGPKRLSLTGSCFTNWEGVVVRCIGLLREAQPENPLAARAAPSEPAASASAPVARQQPRRAEPATRVSETRATALRAGDPGSDLKRALEREEIALAYRPVVSLADQRVAGFEVLLDWRHSERVPLRDDALATLASEHGLGGPLAKYAIAMACVQLYQWQTFFPLARALFATVSLGDGRLLGPDLVVSVRAILSAAALTPGTLRLACDEAMVLSHQAQAADCLAQIKRAGAGVVLKAELGSASALSTLERFPLDAVTLVGVRAGEEGAADAKGLRAIVQRARALHMEVHVSGVEAMEQVQALRAQGCDYASGRQFGAPLPAQDAQALIARDWPG